MGNLDGLYRPREGRMVAGVCKGFAERYGWDPSIVRLVLVLSAIFGAGVPLVAYLIAWVIMPNGQFSLPRQAGSTGPDSMRV
jgi:phage shock protein PspC (stress-responsive transcriptional regulator)